MNFGFRGFVSLAAAVLMGLAGGALPLRPAMAEDLTIGMAQFPSNFHPNIDAMLAKTMVQFMIQRPLTTHDQEWQPICLLCTEYPTFDNGLVVVEPLPDGGQGMAVTYRIQPEATWGDGRPVTAQDALFTWEVGRHPQSGVSNSELYRRILSIDIIDDKTFVVHRDRVEFKPGSIDDFMLLPAHLEQPIFEDDPSQYRIRTTFDSDPLNPGLAFGPYRMAALETGSKIVLERNPTWWGRKPAFDRVTFKIIENTAALEANLLSGGIDMIPNLGLTLDQALAFEKRHGGDYNVLYKSGLIYEHIDVNLDNPLLRDVRMRRALLHAIDRDAVSRKLFQGKQPQADSSVSPLDWVYSDDIAKYPYDPAQSQALLEEMGWGEMKEGVRHNAAGERLTFEIMTTAGNRSRELVEQVLQSQWRQVGIDVRIRNEPARVFFGQTVSQRKFTALAMFAWISSPENVPRTTLHSDQIPNAQNNWAGQNYTGYRNPEMDELLEAISVELDRDKRKALWAKLQAIYARDLPALPLYWRADSFILPHWLKGVQPTGHQGVITLWIENWRSEGR